MKNDVIPYRDSKLTMLLQAALLGNEKLATIVTVTPDTKKQLKEEWEKKLLISNRQWEFKLASQKRRYEEDM
ncbi:hypothetical protein KR018_009274 [Drosophila ironensis]|nr:hypothetical protein KR018_009274 [Drosophila ironensis]